MNFTARFTDVYKRQGYGKIKFSGLNIKSVLGDVHDNILNECKAYLKDVEE